MNEIESVQMGQYFKHPDFGYVSSWNDSHFGAVCVNLCGKRIYRYVMVRELTPVTKQEVDNHLQNS